MCGPNVITRILEEGSKRVKVGREDMTTIVEMREREQRPRQREI